MAIKPIVTTYHFCSCYLSSDFWFLATKVDKGINIRVRGNSFMNNHSFDHNSLINRSVDVKANGKPNDSEVVCVLGMVSVGVNFMVRVDGRSVEIFSKRLRIVVRGCCEVLLQIRAENYVDASSITGNHFSTVYRVCMVDFMASVKAVSNLPVFLVTVYLVI